MVLLPRFISTMAFFIVRHQKNPYFVDFVMNFSIICAAFQISTLISIKKSSKHENLNISLFAAGLHYDTFQSERYLKDLLARH